MTPAALATPLLSTLPAQRLVRALISSAVTVFTTTLLTYWRQERPGYRVVGGLLERDAA